MLDSDFICTYAGVAAEIASARREVGLFLDGCSVRDDVILIVSELASNAIMHSASAGSVFTVRVELHPGHVYIEVEDLGGPWLKSVDHSRPHGLDIVELLAPRWGIAGDGTSVPRVVWAQVNHS